jgi:rubrerythrin
VSLLLLHKIRTKRKEITMKIFDCAIKMEQEARVFYEKLAANATIPELKNLFTLLSESEQEHHDALIKLKEKVVPHDLTFKELQVAACLLKPHPAKHDSDELPDAYQHIVKEEEEGVRFYEDLAAQTDDENARKVMLLIAAEERKHLNIVENIYTFVESPKNFLASAEFNNLKEL